MSEDKLCVTCNRPYCKNRYKGGCDGKDYLPVTTQQGVERIRYHVKKEDS